MKTNIHISLTNFTNETRVLKELHTLTKYELFDQIKVLAIWYPGLKEKEIIDNNIKVYRIRLKTKNLPKHPTFQVIKYLELILSIIIKLKKNNVTAINCHSLGALGIGLILKVIKKAKLIYDTHELETEVHGLAGIRKVLSKLAEKFLINYVDFVTVVGDEICNWYKRSYKINNVYTIPNYPYKSWYKDGVVINLKEKYKIEENKILFIYQGYFTNGRGVEALLNVFSRLDDRKQIVFLGYGGLRDKIIEHSKIFSNIHYHAAVDPKKVLYYTQSANVGINLLDNSCLSRYYSLPNKMFEYLNSGVPVVISNFPESANIIDAYSCGWKIPVKKNVDDEVLYNFIKDISRDEVNRKKEKMKNIQSMFIWERVEQKYIKAFNLIGIEKKYQFKI